MQLMPQMWLDMMQFCSIEFLEMDFNIFWVRNPYFAISLDSTSFIDPPSLECQLYMQVL